MRRPRAPSIAPLLAALLAALALPAAGCHDPKPGGEAAPPPASAPPAVASARLTAPGASSPDPGRPGDRFEAAITANLPRVPDPAIETPPAAAGEELDSAAFRDRVIALVRDVSSGRDKVACALPLPSTRPFQAVVSAYRKGELIGRGEASNASLCPALKDAARRAVAAAGGERDALAGARIVVDLPEHGESMVELDGKGLELTHGLVPVRAFDRPALERRIEEGKGYLLRVLDPEKKGAHKFYHAPADRFEPEVHTIYSASTALTLLKLNARSADKRLVEAAKGAMDFALSMQSHDEKAHTAGAFYYSFHLERKEPERRMVVGTASKTIFTLLELHALTKDKKYMDAARLAADWLLSMQRPDGSVRAYLSEKEGGRLTVSKKESLLYTGQTLSALSRAYGATRDTRYLDAAAQTAAYLQKRVSDKGCYLGDEYRKPNPISSSWVVLSLLDFVKATGGHGSGAQGARHEGARPGAPDAGEGFERTVLRCADKLLEKQWQDPADVYRFGRWQGSLSSSGTGWLAEVMSEVYLHCEEKGKPGCDRYKQAVVRAIRQIMQYTYTPENAFMVKSPEAASGGVFWSVRDRYVRTDAVCHAMNAYLNVLGRLGGGKLLEVPERPLRERLAQAGPGPGADDREDDASGDSDEPGMSRSDDAEGAVEKPPAASMP
ncbi:MAG: terpene cyclase [Polyangiaceae bacterium]|nr:terpene cyclase [Polyangiaceae bacterium]